LELSTVNEPNRRQFIASAAITMVAAALPAVPAVAAVVPEAAVDFGVEFGPPRYFITWWDKVELDSFAVAFAGLNDGRFDAVVDA
jgi:hypothetical protein